MLRRLMDRIRDRNQAVRDELDARQDPSGYRDVPGRMQTMLDSRSMREATRAVGDVPVLAFIPGGEDAKGIFALRTPGGEFGRCTQETFEGVRNDPILQNVLVLTSEDVPGRHPNTQFLVEVREFGHLCTSEDVNIATALRVRTALDGSVEGVQIQGHSNHPNASSIYVDCTAMPWIPDERPHFRLSPTSVGRDADMANAGGASGPSTPSPSPRR